MAQPEPRLAEPLQEIVARPEAEGASSGRLALITSAFCLGIAFAAGALAVIYHQEAGFAGLALLAGLVIVGLGVMAAYATRRPGRTGRDKRARLLNRAFDIFPDPLAVTRADGSVAFANAQYRQMTGAGPAGKPLPPELAGSGDADMAGRLYRLARAAATQGSATADVRATIGGIAHWRRVSVEPLTQGPGGQSLSMWRFRPLAEVTQGGAEFVRTGEIVPFQREPQRAIEAEAPVPLLAAPQPAGAPQPEAHQFEAFDALFASAPVAIALVEADGTLDRANSALAQYLGAADEASLKGKPLEDMIEPDDRAAAAATIAAAAKGEAAAPADVRLTNGAQAQIHAMPVKRVDGSPAAVMLHVIDMTHVKSLERQFAQSQKMEAIGKLAGGVAHDFNNILLAIYGFTDMLLLRHRPGDPSFADLIQIKNSATRAARLVGQLLAFSRRQTLRPRKNDPNELVTEVGELVRRVVTERVQLKHTLGREIWPVRVDGAQFDNMIINLCVNARDAMPGGGTITLTTRNVTETQARESGHDVLTPGDYVLIEVADTGTGIAPENVAKIFEPFFTTKGVGAGTGLGLSMVYGFVKQSGGFIFLDTELGRGTTFKIYLPRYVETAEAKAEAEAEARAKPVARDLTGMGTVLLVEDDDQVRQLAARALTSRGYSVMEASCGESALELLKAAEKPVQILVTDVVMPGMGGPELVKEAKALFPALPVIFMSGYAEDGFRRQADADENAHFLGKPFSLKDLTAKVKDVLESAG
jgi:two-component system, cell cycle sensor histidine kinase and response regulator CckA